MGHAVARVMNDTYQHHPEKPFRTDIERHVVVRHAICNVDPTLSSALIKL